MNVVQMATVADEHRACLFRSLSGPTPTVKLGLLTITGDFGGLRDPLCVVCRYGLFAFTGIDDTPCSRSGGQSLRYCSSQYLCVPAGRCLVPTFEEAPSAHIPSKPSWQGVSYEREKHLHGHTFTENPHNYG